MRPLLDDWSDGPPANWDVHSLPDYLGVLSRWLDESDEHFDGSGVRNPRDGWEVVRVALRRATLHD